MSFKLAQLLNPAPSPQRPSQQPSSPPPAPKEPSPASASQVLPSPELLSGPSPWHRRDSTSANTQAAVASPPFVAAGTLTALATGGASTYHHDNALSGASLSSSREQYSPVNTFGEPRRQSTYASVATPIEPSPPVERPPVLHSPTLDQYHHGSRSPEDPRRQSMVGRSSSPPPKLAPIQTLSGAFGEQTATPRPMSSYARENPYTLPLPQSAVASGPPPTNPSGYVHGGDPGYLRNGPATPQTRDAQLLGNEPQRASHDPSSSPPLARSRDFPSSSPPLARSRDFPSSSPQIKHEPSATTPLDSLSTRQSSQPTRPTPPTENIDSETLRAIEAMKNEHGLRGSKPKQKIENASPEAELAAPVKKRAAPKTTAATKKGVAKKAPATKKRKADGDPASPTSTIRPSPTPSKTSKLALKAGKLSKSNTPSVATSPAPQEPQDEDFEDDAASVDSSGDVFCICRKGDNHTWMIACDGGCEDWFHGKCVKMREEDGDLIDKYICPNCEAKGRGVTTWKPMCRLEGCRKPARVSKSNASKYCSDECGVKFMRLMVAKTNEGDARQKKERRENNRADNTENSTEAMMESDDDDMGPRGGPLNTGEIKALVSSVSDISSFRRLGDGVLTPPYSGSPTATTFPNGELKANGDSDESGDKYPLSYTLLASERERIHAIAEEKDAMRIHKGLLKDRATFVTMAKDQVLRYAERENIKPKDVCGFDSRLSWSDDEFARWRESKAGRTALQMQTLEPADVENGADEDGDDNDDDGEDKPMVNGDLAATQHHDANGEDKMQLDGANGTDGKKKQPDTFCARKRCERHKQWQKVVLQTVRFDEMDLGDKMRALEREERDIRERAMLRWRKEVGGKADENTVELVG